MKNQNENRSLKINPQRQIRRTLHKNRTKEEWMELIQQNLSCEIPDRKIVRAACRAIGVPSEYRSKIWSILLGVPQRRRRSPPELLPKHEDLKPLYNQRTIEFDIKRTRPNLSVFQDESVHKSMEVILTTYCRRKQINGGFF